MAGLKTALRGNTNGTPRGLSNVTVFPNRLANQWQGNQYYAVLENVLEQSDEINLGFRFDTLFGNDWEFTRDIGLFNNAFKTNSFLGVDFPQIYAEHPFAVTYRERDRFERRAILFARRI